MINRHFKFIYFLCLAGIYLNPQEFTDKIYYNFYIKYYTEINSLEKITGGWSEHYGTRVLGCFDKRIWESEWHR